MTQAAVDKLRIFVSSTIKECIGERDTIRKAIRSLNHEPILFEDVGARPQPPREVYRTRLEESHVFVAVYRESYGWIAPDMSISGIEDEFDIATARGMARLVYIYETADGREPRLKSLIDRARASGISTASYSGPEELDGFVRRDVTAVVSSVFASQAVAIQSAPTATDVLDSLVPVKEHRFRRRAVEKAIADCVMANRRVALIGPLGSGKTVMLAQLAVDRNWIFIEGKELSRLDLLASVANAVRKRLDKPAVMVTTEGQAVELYVKAIQALEPSIIAVDGAEHASALCRLPLERHRLVFTSRSPVGWLPVDHHDLPRLTDDEVASWIRKFAGAGIGRNEIERLIGLSEGNPLYLRFYTLGGAVHETLSLRDLEIRAVEWLGPREREIVTYASLSPHPLSLGDLTAMMEPQDGPEAIAEYVSKAGGLLIRGPRGIQLIHEHLRTTVMERLRALPERWSFFTLRLGGHLERGGHFLAAFHMYLDVGSTSRADQILTKAAIQAVLSGGGGIAVPVFRRQAELASGMNESTDEVYALLNLAYALAQRGDTAEASCKLARAQQIAGASNPLLNLRLREIEIVVGMAAHSGGVRIGALEQLVAKYEDLGEQFHGARIRTFLGKEYIGERRFEEAAAVSRAAHQVLQGLGDEYGVEVASVNLAVALSAIPGRANEALSIAQTVQLRWSPEEYPRLRGVICNLLTRHYRESGELDTAARHAIEAISIGEALTENSVICINRTNLGNVYRDGGQIEEALAQYKLAEKAAVVGDYAEGEAWANQLIASVRNDRGEYSLAEHHARYASAIGSRIDHRTTIARAQKELAVALSGQGDVEAAVEAYAAACTAAFALDVGRRFFVSLLCDGLAFVGQSGRTDLKPRLLDLAVNRVGHVDRRSADGGEVGILYEGLVKLAILGIGNMTVPVVSLIMWDVFANRPGIVERRMVRQAVKEIIDQEDGDMSRSAMGAVAALLMTQSGKFLGLSDVAYLAEMVASASDRVHYKPHLEDGAGHWTVRLEMGDGVLVSVTQLDDSVRTSIITMNLVLLFAICDKMIWQDVMERSGAGGRELMVSVCSKSDLDAQLGSETSGLVVMKDNFAVIGIRGEKSGHLLATWEGDFGGAWRPMVDGISDIHKLFGALICSMVTGLLSGEVEQEVLVPKVVRLVRRMGYDNA